MAIVHLPPPASAEIRSLWGREKSPYGFGDAGMQLERKLDDACRHWSKPDEAADEESATDLEVDDVDDFTYQSVKLPIVGTVMVRFTKAEPLRAMPYVLDDEED